MLISIFYTIFDFLARKTLGLAQSFAEVSSGKLIKRERWMFAFDVLFDMVLEFVASFSIDEHAHEFHAADLVKAVFDGVFVEPVNVGEKDADVVITLADDIPFFAAERLLYDVFDAVVFTGVTEVHEEFVFAGNFASGANDV